MKTNALRLALAAFATLSMTACGGSQDTDSSNEFQEPQPTPEASPEVPPDPTPVPNTNPDAPVFTLSAISVKPTDVVTIDLALVDADGDALTSVLSALLVLETGDVLDISGNLTKVSETQYTFVAPITEMELGTVYFRALAADDRGGVSDATDSTTLTIDNRVHEDPTDRNVCPFPKAGCKIVLDRDDLKLDVTVPDPQIYIPDQLRGTYFEIPSTDFVASVDLDVNTTVAKWSIADANLPSIQVTVGTDAVGYGYSLEIYPVAVNGVLTPNSMLLVWKWRARALASNAMTRDNLLGGTILAQGNLGALPPTHLDASIRDGILRFTINGTVQTPSIAATNLAGSQLGFSSRATQVSFMNPTAVLKP